MNAVLHRYLSFFIVVLTDTVAVLVVAMTALYVVTAVAVAEVDFVLVMVTATTAVVATVHWVNLTLHSSCLWEVVVDIVVVDVVDADKVVVAALAPINQTVLSLIFSQGA